MYIYINKYIYIYIIYCKLNYCAALSSKSSSSHGPLLPEETYRYLPKWFDLSSIEQSSKPFMKYDYMGWLIGIHYNGIMAYYKSPHTWVVFHHHPLYQLHNQGQLVTSNLGKKLPATGVACAWLPAREWMSRGQVEESKSMVSNFPGTTFNSKRSLKIGLLPDPIWEAGSSSKTQRFLGTNCLCWAVKPRTDLCEQMAYLHESYYHCTWIL